MEPESHIVRAAVAKLVSELGRGHRTADDDVMARLCRLGGDLFAAGTYAPEDDTKLAVAGLCELAWRDEPHVAERAQRALLAIGRPHDVDFWRDLATAPRPAPLALIFAGLSRFSLEEAFAYMREAIREEHAIVEARIALMEALPALDRQAPYVVQHHFAEFLAMLAHDDRSYLMAAPALGGLKWSLPPLDRALAARFFSTLQQWTTLLDGAHEDDRVLQVLTAIGKQVEELAAEAFHTLTPTEQRRAGELLTAKIGERAGAAVCVPVLLNAGRETDLARALVVRKRYREPRSVVRWYLEVSPRRRLRRAQDKALVKALHDALDRSLPFLASLTERARREGIEIPELDWVPGLEVKAQFLVETEEYAFSNEALGQINEELLLQIAGGDSS